MADRCNRIFHHSLTEQTSKGTYLYCFILIALLHLTLSSVVSLSSKCDKTVCFDGECINGTCICNKGWAGNSCGHCSGRLVLKNKTGFITDGYGNYSEDNKCTWLIDTGAHNSTIHLQIHQFSTECGWDHLYVYDGDSVFSPLLAAYSGLIQQEVVSDAGLPVITASSGKAYIYFYSDAAYNMSGFNLTYSVDSCPKDCLGHGTCSHGKCTCDPMWTGKSCDTELCPDNCSQNGRCVDKVCVCNEDYTGTDCSVSLSDGYWSSVPVQNLDIGRGSAATAVLGHLVYMAGGHTFDNKYTFLSRFDLNADTWEEIIPTNNNVNPSPRYGHTLVANEGKLYMFGGVVDENDQTQISRSLFIFDIKMSTWSRQDVNSSRTIPVAVAGHTAHILNNVMYIIFGHSPVYGYKNKVQEYFIGNHTWAIPKTSGAVIQGWYGHTSTYDPTTGFIYVYGGYHSGSPSNYQLTDEMYGYHPTRRAWLILRGNNSPRYLHSASYLDGLIYIFGGNTHNDTSVSYGAKCYSPHLMVYDIECNSWYTVNSTTLPSNGARYGHQAAMYIKNGVPKMYIFGGFNGIMQNNILQFTPGNCSNYKDNSSCVMARQGVKCVWVFSAGCMSLSMAKLEGYANDTQMLEIDTCDPAKGGSELCPKILSCSTCLSTRYGCKWCNNNCSSSCSVVKNVVDSSAKCNPDSTQFCHHIYNCYACQSSPQCAWESSKCSPRQKDGDSDYSHEKCKVPCYMHSDCENCTHSNCMWCANKQRCVDTNSYVASFLYGQCMEWMTSEIKCPATKCSNLATCDQCQSNPMCGWCNDPSNTGIGKCMEGGAKGPGHNPSTGNSTMCPNSRWFFEDCPACQCNGHSTCNNKTHACENCQNMTTGPHCETCIDGYFGDPTNGGKCSLCECNDQAVTCDNRTGNCFCRTRGVIGTHCEECDTIHKYHGNPKNGGTCYYDLVTDYQFTFNLSKRDDIHYTQINFMNMPTSKDRDVDFKVNCSGSAFLNISIRTNSRNEFFYLQSYDCSSYFTSKFERQDYSFGSAENTTFLVYVYGFQTPFWLQISFSQFPKIDLVHFFVTFFSCFLSLLIIAAVLYKIKHKYDNYRRRQRMIVEMEEMASRPFSSVTLEIDRKPDNCIAEKKDPNTELRKRKKVHNKPSQVTLEPLANQKAAVLTLVVQLPTGDEDWTPNGSSGIAIASALVTLGHHRKQSVEHGGKGDKNKFKKHQFPAHSDTCV